MRDHAAALKWKNPQCGLPQARAPPARDADEPVAPAVRVGPQGVARDAFLARMADQFRAVTDDAAGAPVLVHCVAGRDRTGTACAAYRMEYDGWGPERAAAEMREYGFDPDRDAAAGAYWRFVLNYRARRAAG